MAAKTLAICITQMINPSAAPQQTSPGSLSLQETNYKDNNGLVLNIQVPDTLGVKNYKATFSWLADGKPNISADLNIKDLNTAIPPQSGKITNNLIQIQRPEVTEYVVLLVILDLS